MPLYSRSIAGAIRQRRAEIPNLDQMLNVLMLLSTLVRRSQVSDISHCHLFMILKRLG
jgi:hypothetical protein